MVKNMGRKKEKMQVKSGFRTCDKLFKIDKVCILIKDDKISSYYLRSIFLPLLLTSSLTLATYWREQWRMLKVELFTKRGIL